MRFVSVRATIVGVAAVAPQTLRTRPPRAKGATRVSRRPLADDRAIDPRSSCRFGQNANSAALLERTPSDVSSRIREETGPARPSDAPNRGKPVA
ncbi:MAG TPA: hypothetical protein DCQ98_12785 [Planctomycetaceae bacterium]|nr:hypothetical protein [Planctomycetaceae bacterium]